VRVLGIDPGTRHFGWGVVVKDGLRLSHVAHGVIDTDTDAPICDRLVEIERALELVVREHSPSAASVESLFFHKDAQAAAKLGHARGVALLVCARAGMKVAEYPPARVKLTVAGGGRADKNQVAQMIRVLLGLASAPRSDAADALALAVTHLQRAHLEARAHFPVAPPSGGARISGGGPTPLAAMIKAAEAAARKKARSATVGRGVVVSRPRPLGSKPQQ
jgi:crossover junction endodeoxyribonuclease RuvC